MAEVVRPENTPTREFRRELVDDVIADLNITLVRPWAQREMRRCYVTKPEAPDSELVWLWWQVEWALCHAGWAVHNEEGLDGDMMMWVVYRPDSTKSA